MDISRKLYATRFNAVEWLNKRAKDNERLDNRIDLKGVLDFCLMWNLFESVACDKAAGVKKFSDKVNELQSKRCLETQAYDPYISYFTQRYISDGNFNERFDKLNFRRNDKRRLVEQVLQRTTVQSSDKVVALLIIVYRLRNGLFHGFKDVYKLTYQTENFEVANRVLATFLDDVRRCN